jgi:hypothetical protein
MATLSMSFTVLSILAKEHPNGLTREELFEKASAHDPDRFGDCIGMLDIVIRTENGVRSDDHCGLVSCWKIEDGKIFYDTSRKSYAPSLEFCGFSLLFNDWLRKEDLSHLILYERLTPENSEKCPLGFDWESILSPGHCSWDYENEECDAKCRVSKKQFDMAVLQVEKRQYTDYYKKSLSGD